MKAQTSFKGILILFLTALIWGTSFVSQSEGMKSVDAFTFIAIRTLLGTVFLFPYVLIRDISTARKMTPSQIEQRKRNYKKTLKYGAILGFFLAAATNLQQFAFYYSVAGKIAFVTSMYMFFVPIIGLFFKKRIPFITWICVAIAFVGMYFLCFAGNKMGSVNYGDILSVVCAVFFGFQIIFIEKFAAECDAIKLSFVQFSIAGLITLVLMFIFEKPQWEGIKGAAIPLLYAGVMSCGIAYTLQVIGQKYCEATIATLVMSTESVFAVLSAAIILHERLSVYEIAGCCIIFGAILISQVSDIIRQRRNQ